MGLGTTTTVSLLGVTGHIVHVEADIANGLPHTTIVGMGDTAVDQARERVRAAVTNSRLPWQMKRLTVSLAPAGLPKRGAGFDLAIAVALLAADGEVPLDAAAVPVLIGELGLDGSIRPVPGVLPCLLAAAAAGHRSAIVPEANLTEAQLVDTMAVRGAATLADLVEHLRGHPGTLIAPTAPPPPRPDRVPDMADVLGQPQARYALELAAAGGHHMAMIGPPGAGKTMLAARLPGILPPLTEQQALEVTAIHSITGSLDPQAPLVARPPFVDPHHSASQVAMIGGGSGEIRPGSVSLAHCGVLFLDEAPEFHRGVLDALRQPMESGSVLIMRSKHMARFPSRFQLVLAANPCPCAAARDIDCTCASGVRRRYLSRLSGPLMDRVDVRIDVPPVDLVALTGHQEPGESSAAIVERVITARDRSAHRWRDQGWTCNGQVPTEAVRDWWKRTMPYPPMLTRAVRLGRLTARGHDRVLRLALTSADLASRGRPSESDLAMALALRCGEAA